MGGGPEGNKLDHSLNKKCKHSIWNIDKVSLVFLQLYKRSGVVWTDSWLAWLAAMLQEGFLKSAIY